MAPALLIGLLLAADPFVASGEVLFNLGGTGTSAAFDGDRVVGPAVNMTRMPDGGWSGDIRGRSVALKVTDQKLTAPNVELFLRRTAAGRGMRGTVFGKRCSLEWGARKLTGRVGSCSVDLTRAQDGSFGGEMGCMEKHQKPVVTRVVMKLEGQASEVDPPLPQFALALLAVFP